MEKRVLHGRFTGLSVLLLVLLVSVTFTVGIVKIAGATPVEDAKKYLTNHAKKEENKRPGMVAYVNSVLAPALEEGTITLYDACNDSVCHPQT